ncbi:MAG: hypothetical protein O3B22_01895 [Proteobacteria bacterium]|nr:hypothetical protein [Pseudomonadota bacterium]MDA0951507.1 hypothetical protein [Pseudomonadota bacterium]MDA1071343.1 hypothetical protein [Pseudomonadota bacterium]
MRLLIVVLAVMAGLLPAACKTREPTQPTGGADGTAVESPDL